LHREEGLDDGVERKDQQGVPSPTGQVVAVIITVIAVGIGLLIVVAIVVGIVDATQASTWREVAAERRRRWEARQVEFHGGVDHGDSYDGDSWDDD
jgi:hypothetical protein